LICHFQGFSGRLSGFFLMEQLGGPDRIVLTLRDTTYSNPHRSRPWLGC
jgi:hypothetical protein